MRCILHRLTAKCAISRVKTSVSSVLAPLQLGFGVPKNAVAATHAAIIYVCKILVLVVYDSALVRTLHLLPG